MQEFTEGHLEKDIEQVLNLYLKRFKTNKKLPQNQKDDPVVEISESERVSTLNDTYNSNLDKDEMQVFPKKLNIKTQDDVAKRTLKSINYTVHSQDHPWIKTMDFQFESGQRSEFYEKPGDKVWKLEKGKKISKIEFWGNKNIFFRIKIFDEQGEEMANIGGHSSKLEMLIKTLIFKEDEHIVGVSLSKCMVNNNLCPSGIKFKTVNCEISNYHQPSLSQFLKMGYE